MYVDENLPSFQQDILDKCFEQLSNQSKEIHKDHLSIIFAALEIPPYNKVEGKNVFENKKVKKEDFKT